MNSFAGNCWLVLAQLQNRFFIEHLPVAAYVRCLKEKKNESSVWQKKWTAQSGILCGIANFSRGNKNKLRTFQPQKWKILRTASLKQNLLVLVKKTNDVRTLNDLPINWENLPISRLSVMIFHVEDINFKLSKYSYC